MSNSLRDQLLKAGLVTEDQVRRARGEEHRKRAARRRKERRGEQTGTPLARAAQAEKKARDRVLNAEQEARRAERERRKQLRKLLNTKRVNDGEGEIAHHFTLDSHVKKVYVDRRQNERLARGELAIVVYNRRYHVVPLATAEQVRALAPELPVIVAEDRGAADDGVPDDLMW